MIASRCLLNGFLVIALTMSVLVHNATGTSDSRSDDEGGGGGAVVGGEGKMPSWMARRYLSWGPPRRTEKLEVDTRRVMIPPSYTGNSYRQTGNSLTNSNLVIIILIIITTII